MSPRHDPYWPTARDDAYYRDRGRCIMCGAEATEVNHRRPRGMGGNRKDPDRHSPDRLATACSECHRHYETTARAEGYRLGFFVPAGIDPARWPIKHFSLGWTVLTADGGRRPADPDPTQTAQPTG